MSFEAREIDTLDFLHKAYRDDLRFEGGLLKHDCAGLYYGPNDHPPAREQGNL